MSKDKNDAKPKPQLPPPIKCPKPQVEKTKEYGDGAADIEIESDKS